MEFSKERIENIAKFMLLKGISIPEGMIITELVDALKKLKTVQDADPMDNIEIVNQQPNANPQPKTKKSLYDQFLEDGGQLFENGDKQ